MSTLRTHAARLARETNRPGATVAYAAQVAQDVAAPGDLVDIVLANTEDQAQLASEQAPWPARQDASLPQRGDECLVVIDDTGRPWVVAWNQSGY